MRVFYCFASRASRVCSNFDQKRELNVLISGRGRKWDGRTKVWWESLTSTQPTLASHSGLTLANTQPTLASHPPIVGGFCFTLPALGPSHRQESGRGMHRYLPGDMATMHKLFNASALGTVGIWMVPLGLMQETAQVFVYYALYLCVFFVVFVYWVGWMSPPGRMDGASWVKAGDSRSLS